MSLEPPRAYSGLATRTLAFGADAAIINGVAWSVAAIVALCLSLIAIPEDVAIALAAVGTVIAIVWAVAYFAFCWSATGQTPGDRLMRIRVLDARTGRPPSAGRATLRVAALPLSAIPLCAGFLLILVDSRRRALHDRLVRTVVVDVPPRVRSARRPVPAQHPAEQDLARADGR